MNESSYLGRSSELLKNAEFQLKSTYEELKNFLSHQECGNEQLENCLRSIPLPKDFSYFGLEREHLIKKTLRVPQGDSIFEHMDETPKQLDSALNSDYSLDVVPLLLYQHFSDRCASLKRMEHLLVERWTKWINEKDNARKRPVFIDKNVFKIVEEKLRMIREEHETCRERFIRLSPSREAFLTKDSHNLLTSVEPDDLLNYLHFMVGKFSTTRRMQQFLRVIECLPTSMDIQDVADDKVMFFLYIGGRY